MVGGTFVGVQSRPPPPPVVDSKLLQPAETVIPHLYVRFIVSCVLCEYDTAMDMNKIEQRKTRGK